MRGRWISLRLKLALTMLGAAALAAAAAAWLTASLGSAVLGAALGIVVALVPLSWLAARAARPVAQLSRALSGIVVSFREGDFSVSLAADRRDELGDLMLAHNQLAEALRTQRAHLVQRELLLDTVMQNSPVALLLIDAHDRVAYANIAARQLLAGGRSLNGLRFADALKGAPAALREVAGAQSEDASEATPAGPTVPSEGGGAPARPREPGAPATPREPGDARATPSEGAAAPADRLFTTEIEGMEETFHLSQRAFVLQGREFRLYLLKRLTRELSRQEVSTWKKLIRVLSHELNNSLGPLSSLAQSGAQIARRGDAASLPAVFAAIGERAQHLHRFVAGYAAFAKLPAPRPATVEWAGLVADLRRHYEFVLAGSVPEQAGWFDRAQLEQALINLLKNAHEAGGDAGQVELAVSLGGGVQQIEVRDRGGGMSPAVLAQALLPFYSTKRSGTGLGLALAREIVEAHAGRIQLVNRSGGGLSVVVELPMPGG